MRTDAVLVDVGDPNLSDSEGQNENPAWRVDGGRGGVKGRIGHDQSIRVVSCPASGIGRMFAAGYCPDV